MRVLVTGADGFVARHLVPLLLGQGHEVVGTALQPERAPRAIRTVPLDVTNAAACREALTGVQPTHLVHLAAASSVRWSFDHPTETHRINVEGTRNILEAALALKQSRAAGSVPRLLIVGSSEEYGVNDGRPLPELPTNQLRPLSPYAVSKVEVERMIEAEPRFRGCVIRTRSFPHFGPGQQTGFFTADVASALMAIERGDGPNVLRVGDVEVVRDYLDVRDVVRAYALLLARGVPGEVYNVSSGHGSGMRELLDTLVRLAGVGVTVAHDPHRARPAEISVLVGNSAKLRAATGWAPEIPLAASLADVLAWWRTQPAPVPHSVVS